MRLRHLVAITALTWITAFFVVVPTELGIAESAPEPVTTVDRHLPLLKPDDVRAGDADEASPGDRQLARVQAAESGAPVADPDVLEVTAPEPLPGTLAVVGVTWQRDAVRTRVVQYRTRQNGRWSPWQAAQTDVAARPEGSEPGERDGSEPIVISGAEQVQARLLGARGDAPSDAQLTVIDPQAAASDQLAGRNPVGSAAAATPRPPVHSRSEWGADESLRRAQPSYGVVRGIVIHHTAGSNSYTPAQVPAIVRGIYAFHVTGRRWNDIGYNALVDKWGRIWEGRYGGLENAVVGAHTSGYNSVTAGITVMGDHSTVAPSAQAVEAVTRLVAWKADHHGFSANGTTTLHDRRFPTVIGHRDAGPTSCPGAALYGWLPTIRARAARLQTSPVTAQPGQQPVSPPVRDLDGSAGDDVLARDRHGDLYALSVTGAGSMTAPTRIGRRWTSIDALLGGRWNSDGIPDLLARERGSGRLKLYAMSGTGRLAAPRTVGRGWGTMTRLLAPGDLTGDRHDDILAVHRSGRLYVYPVTASGAVLAGRQVGRGWGGFRHLTAVGDWTGDRRPDLVGVLSSGRALLYPSAPGGSFQAPRTVNGDWSRLSQVASARPLAGSAPARLISIASGNETAVGTVGNGTINWVRVSPGLAGFTLYLS